MSDFTFSYNTKEPSMSRAMKIKIFVLVCICIALIIGFAYYAYQMDRDPEMIIHDDSIRIIHFYGLIVDFSNITEISLLDRSVQRIYMGYRTNAGIGHHIAKGYFQGGLFFMHLKAPLVIRITRRNAVAIYINFRNDTQTEQVYSLLRAKYYQFKGVEENTFVCFIYEIQL